MAELEKLGQKYRVALRMDSSLRGILAAIDVFNDYVLVGVFGRKGSIPRSIRVKEQNCEKLEVLTVRSIAGDLHLSTLPENVKKRAQACAQVHKKRLDRRRVIERTRALEKRQLRPEFPFLPY